MITNINKIIVAVALIILARNSCAGQLNDAFLGLEVGIYTGKLMLPTGYVVVDGIWRDNVGKEIAEPKVNFAGKYWVGLHSCGFGCRYYSMVDLSSGTETHMLDIFSSTDPPAKTRDGHLYFSNLVTRAQSKMLIAQYHVTLDPVGTEECRERVFTMKEIYLIPLTKTKIGCRS
jgi:hypothetical protein